jgi:hypothetical protein
VKEREIALQSLDIAYHKYREVAGNLDEGIKVSCHYSYDAAESEICFEVL